MKRTRSDYRCGELARLAGISADTVRYYERNGLVPGVTRSANGYRQFPPQALIRIRLIRSALSVGFTITELGGFLRERDRGGTPCRSVRALIGKKMEGLEERLKQLRRLRKQLREVMEEWDGLLERNPPEVRAGLLDALAVRKGEPFVSGSQHLLKGLQRRKL